MSKGDLSLPFDQYQRYRLVADLINQVRPEGRRLRVLDVGGRTGLLKRFLPSELKKGKHFSAFNQFPVTLEEEMVDKMAPLVKHSGASNLDYKPVEDDSINSSSIHSE